MLSGKCSTVTQCHMTAPFVAAVQRSPAELQQRPAQSWFHHHTPAPAAVTLVQASSLLDAAPAIITTN